MVELLEFVVYFIIFALTFLLYQKKAKINSQVEQKK